MRNAAALSSSVKILFAVLLVSSVLIPRSSAGQDRSALSKQDVTRISEASEAFSAAVRVRNVKGLVSLYTDEGVLYPPGETAVKGHAAIEACLAALPPMKDFSLRIVKVEGQGDIAYVQGTYMMTIAAPGAAEPIQASGYYVEVRRRQPDGRWLLAVHMLTSHD